MPLSHSSRTTIRSTQIISITNIPSEKTTLPTELPQPTNQMMEKKKKKTMFLLNCMHTNNNINKKLGEPLQNGISSLMGCS